MTTTKTIETIARWINDMPASSVDMLVDAISSDSKTDEEYEVAEKLVEAITLPQ